MTFITFEGLSQVIIIILLQYYYVNGKKKKKKVEYASNYVIIPSLSQ